MKKNALYAVVCFDGCNGACFEGIAEGSDLNKAYPNAGDSRNNDGLYELDEEGMMFAIPVVGKKYVPEVEEDGDD